MANSGGQYKESQNGRNKRKRKQGKRLGKRKKKTKKEKTMEVKKIAEEWEI